MVGESHLLCSLFKLGCVDPFVIPRAANVIKMVVYTSTTRPASFVGEGETTNVAPVIVCLKKSNAFWDDEASLDKTGPLCIDTAGMEL